MKIMICEGNEDKAKVLADLLNVYQFKLVKVLQGADFVKQVKTHRPSVIILNETFANGSGKEIIQQLRMNSTVGNTPIILISNGNNGEIMDFSGDSLVQLMREPFKIKHLRHCVDRWTLFRSLYVKQ